MKLLQLENNVKIPALAAGCMRICALDPSALTNWLETNLACGINLFDHADIYGRKVGGLGHCEKLFGDILAQNPGLREKIIIQTKCGIREGCFDFSYDHIISSVEGSLKRLQTDHIDILILHRPDTLVEPEEVAAAFDLLRSSGKVKMFGVSNHNASQMAFLQKYLPDHLWFNQLQFGPAHTPLLDSGLNVNIANNAGTMYTDGIIEYCRANHVTIQTWSPFIYGFFTGIFRTAPQYDGLNQALEKLGEKYGISADAATVAWILRHPAQMQMITGTTQAARIQDLSQGSEIVITREEWYEIYRAAGNTLP